MTSAMAYVAYAPVIMSVVFDLPVTGMALIVAWLAVVLFTIAAPGLSAGMGTALWSSRLFAALLGLTENGGTDWYPVTDGQIKSASVGSWVG